MQKVEVINAENSLLHARKNGRYEGIMIHKVTTQFSFRNTIVQFMIQCTVIAEFRTT